MEFTNDVAASFSRLALPVEQKELHKTFEEVRTSSSPKLSIPAVVAITFFNVSGGLAKEEVSISSFSLLGPPARPLRVVFRTPMT